MKLVKIQFYKLEHHITWTHVSVSSYIFVCFFFYLVKRERNAEVVCGIFETKWKIL